jgi:hypothetical protein
MDRGPISQSQDFRAKAAMDRLGYTSSRELLAEKSSCSSRKYPQPGLVARLKAGTGPIGGYMAPRTAGRAQQEVAVPYLR